MAIWEKTILNMQQGAQKLTAFAELFSERVKAEIAIARLRIRINDVQAEIDELYKTIGRTVVELKNKGAMPKTSEQLLSNAQIAAAMGELVEHQQEITDLLDEMQTEQEARKPVPKEKAGDTE